MERHEISLLEEELVQLTAKSLKVIPGDSLTEDDLELGWRGDIGCLEDNSLFLIECDKKDLMHVIGSMFGGVIRSKVKGDFFRLRVQLEVRKPLRRDIFISANKKKK
ncbi:hypothetical protein Gorai_013063, partial [Gossypium raimondii]|nr:hypothetical protein [Gossypium raimondii]